MRLNYLKLSPRPYDFDSEGIKSADLLIAELIAFVDEQPESKLMLSINGFFLENLQQRGRKAFLKKLAELSKSGKIELLRTPFFEPSRQVVTKELLVLCLRLQEEFWNEYQARLSTTIDLSAGSHLLAVFLLLEPMLEEHLLIPGLNTASCALCQLTPTITATPLSSELSISDRVTVKVNRLVLNSLKNYQNALSQFFTCLQLPDQIASAELRSATPRVATSEKAQAIPQTNHLADRALLLWKQIESAPELVAARLDKAREEKIERIGDESRLKEAARFYLRSTSACILDDATNPKAQRACLDFLLRGEVELESYLHPEADPTIGWVRLAEWSNGPLINTQLTDIFLSSDGAVTEFDYKPQKVSLIGAFPSRAFEVFSEVSPQNRSLQGPKIVRKSLDLVTLRYIEGLNSDASLIVRELTIKAGVGAHLPNATTGFNMEYRVEGEKLLGELQLSMTLTTPSTSPLTCSFKPLLCVGGVSDQQLPVEEPREILTSEAPGGLFGLRFIDRLEDLTLDLRSAKQLERITIEPVVIQDVFQAVTVNFFVTATRLHGDDRSNTVFLSVM